MKNIHPVYLTHEYGVDNIYINAALDGINEMLALAYVTNKIPVVNYGMWRNKNYRLDNRLVDFQSIDWFIGMGIKHSTRPHQLNSGKILDLMTVEPLRKTVPHYDVFVVRQDIYPGDNTCNFVIGIGRRGAGTVVSTNRFMDLGSDRNQYEVFKTCLMHEFGHVIGLINTFRTQNIEENLGPHCTNRCIMRQGLSIPAFVKITNDRLNHGPLCGQCRQDLINYFK